jgi:hypothetical protein
MRPVECSAWLHCMHDTILGCGAFCSSSGEFLSRLDRPCPERLQSGAIRGAQQQARCSMLVCLLAEGVLWMVSNLQRARSLRRVCC